MALCTGIRRSYNEFVKLYIKHLSCRKFSHALLRSHCKESAVFKEGGLMFAPLKPTVADFSALLI